MKNEFDEDYFENGMMTGKSCYVNYRWMPELTIKMAHSIIQYLDIKNNDKVLDFGCAKGFLVKALRILDVDAYGCDISEYAIASADHEIKEFCRILNGNLTDLFADHKFDWVMSKDVLEHMLDEDIDNFLSNSIMITDRMFHVVPLGGEDGKYVIPAYELDKTHIQRHTIDWWVQKFKANGWNNIEYNYNVKGVKDNWTKEFDFGNAFFILNK